MAQATVKATQKSILDIAQDNTGRAVTLSATMLRKVSTFATESALKDLAKTSKLSNAELLKEIGARSANTVVDAGKSIEDAYATGLFYLALKVKIQEGKVTGGWKQYHGDNAKAQNMLSYSYIAKLIQIATAGLILTKTDELGRPWTFNSYYKWVTKGTALSEAQTAAHKTFARKEARKDSATKPADIAISEASIKVTNNQTLSEKVEVKWDGIAKIVEGALYEPDEAIEGHVCTLDNAGNRAMLEYLRGSMQQIESWIRDIEA